MKYLLAAINAKYIHINPAVYLLRDYVRSAADARCAKADIKIAEFTINEPFFAILSGIANQKPDFIGISCYIWNWGIVTALLPEIKKILPDVLLFLGGPEVSFRPEEILSAYPSADGVICGEGEDAFLQLVCTGESKGSAALKLRAPVAGKPADLNALPFIYRDLSAFDNKILYYETSRGCPFSCSYCLSAAEKGLRFRNPELVKNELQFFLDHRVRQVKFLDRTFNCSERHALAVWSFLKEHDNGITNFHFELEAGILTEAELDLLSRLRPGLVQVEIGVQSTNSQTLRAVNRHTDNLHLSACVRRILASGNIHTHLDLIAGLPKEGYQSFRSSFNDVYALHPHELQLGFLKVLHGSPIENQAGEFGIRSLSCPPYEVLSTKWLCFEEIERLKKIEAVLEIYWNSGQFAYTMRVLESFFPAPFDLYSALADYYDTNHYFTAAPARSKRYELLLDFISRTLPPPVPEQLFRELLTFDYYLRENAKSRPSFAPETPRTHRRNELFHEETFAYPLFLIRPFGEADLPGLAPLPDPAKIRFDYTHRDPVTHFCTWGRF